MLSATAKITTINPRLFIFPFLIFLSPLNLPFCLGPKQAKNPAGKLFFRLIRICLNCSLVYTLCRRNLVLLPARVSDHERRCRLRVEGFGVSRLAPEANVQDRLVCRGVWNSPIEKRNVRIGRL